jgi:hypothetical protein
MIDDIQRDVLYSSFINGSFTEKGDSGGKVKFHSYKIAVVMLI